MAILRCSIFMQIAIFLMLLEPYYLVHGKGLQIKSRRGLVDRLRKYDVVTPHRLEGRHRREANTLTQDGHMTEASFLLPAFGKEYILDVRLNEKLFPKRYVETVYTEDGQLITRLPHEHHHCYYHGAVRGGNVSAVAISTCGGLSGMVNVDGEALRVEPLDGSSWQHIVYRPEDVVGPEYKLGNDVKLSPSEPFPDVATEVKGRYRRDILAETKYIELVIVNDDTEYRLKGYNLATVQEESKRIANQLDMLYKPLNIRIALVNVEVWTSPQISITHVPEDNLRNFQTWRKDVLNERTPNDNAQLITAVPFQNSIVGMAEYGKICTEDRSCGINSDIEDLDFSRRVGVIAHELGHNLGFLHDGPDCECPEAECMMEDTLPNPAPTHFSSCSKDTLEKMLQKGFGVCLLGYPKTFYQGPICGNSFLDRGEDCDCGMPQECTTECCDPLTCKFRENATCSEGACCDSTCRMKAAGSPCRDIFNECDLPEYCMGTSADCPDNVYRQNGEKCKGDRDAHCYDGQCLSYQRQCEDVWGKGTGVRVGADVCFKQNTQGNHLANCGETSEQPCPTEHWRQSSSDPCYKQCEPENVFCGRLMCENVPAYPVLSSIAKIARTGDLRGTDNRIHVCKTVSFNYGNDVPDPGYVAEGTTCAEGKVCKDFKCQNIVDAGITECPDNCNGNGVCNSQNNCHCDMGWAPPLCNVEGNGGSIDSGPAQRVSRVIVTPTPKSPIVSKEVPRPRPTIIVPTNTDGNNTDGNNTDENNAKHGKSLRGLSPGVVAALLIFLFFLPLILIGILIYCQRERVKRIWSQRCKTNTRRQSFKNESPAANKSRNIGRSSSLRTGAGQPSIQHVPNSSTGNVVHDVYPLIPTVGYKPESNRPPVRPVSPPPARSSSGPTRPSAPPSQPSGRPTAPPSLPAEPPTRPRVPPLKPTARSQSFNVIGDGRPKPPPPPFKLAPPPKSPPPVPQPGSAPQGIAGARAALKPVSRPRPNANSNNSKDSKDSKDCDWRRGGDSITQDHGEQEQFLSSKPKVSKKPSVAKKPLNPPSRPPLRTQSMRESSNSKQ